MQHARKLGILFVRGKFAKQVLDVRGLHVRKNRANRDITKQYERNKTGQEMYVGRVA